MKSFVLITLVALTGCLGSTQTYQLRCEAPKVLEDAFIACLEVNAKVLKELQDSRENLVYYKDKNYELERGVCTRSYE